MKCVQAVQWQTSHNNAIGLERDRAKEKGDKEIRRKEIESKGLWVI